MCGREGAIVELVEDPELFFEQERAVERLVGFLDLVEQRELLDRLFGGRFEQRPARALDPLSLGCVGALVRVSFIAADLIDRALGQAHHMKRSKRDLGLRDALADRLLIAAGHIDRDGLDRGLALPELIEEALQGGGIATRGTPHDRPGVVVDDRREVAMMAPVADLVHADRDEPLEAAVIEVIGDDPLNDLPDRVSPDPEQASDRGLGHLLRQPRHKILEVAGVVSICSGPRHRLQVHATVAAAQPPQL